jgi:hypothetical protein
MTCLRFAAALAALLTAGAFAVPAQAASNTNLAAKHVWSAMDQCSKAAHDKFPDETADALAKRDAFVHNCQRDARVPVREGQAPKK